MSDDVFPIIALLAHAGLALLFLLVGWRLGRESTGRPMFDYPLRPPASPETPEAPDPWTAAALSLHPGRQEVDTFQSQERFSPDTTPGYDI